MQSSVTLEFPASGVPLGLSPVSVLLRERGLPQLVRSPGPWGSQGQLPSEEQGLASR